MGNWSEIYRRQQEGARLRNEARHRSRLLLTELRELEASLTLAASELAKGNACPFTRLELCALQRRRHALKKRLGHGLVAAPLDI